MDATKAYEVSYRVKRTGRPRKFYVWDTGLPGAIATAMAYLRAGEVLLSVQEAVPSPQIGLRWNTGDPVPEDETA